MQQPIEGVVVAAITALPSRETQRAYQAAWRGWTGFLAQRGRTPGEATAEDVRAWADQMRRAGRRPATISARVAACRAVCGRLGGPPAGAGAIFAVRLPAGRREGGLVPRLSAAQVRRLLAAIDRRTVSGARDYALLGLLAVTSARASQVLRLTVGDVLRTPDGQVTAVWFAWEAEMRLAPGWVYEAVRAYLTLAGRTTAPDNAPLWLPLPGWARPAALRLQAGPIGVAQVNNILRRRLEQAGIEIPEQYSTGSLRRRRPAAG